MRTRMYGGVGGRKTKVGGKPTFVFLLLDFSLERIGVATGPRAGCYVALDYSPSAST